MSKSENIEAIAHDILCVVPARGGSTRVPRKNIRELGGKPLLVHTLDAVTGSGLDLSLVVSTDDPLIAEVASESGASVLMRPKELASSTASTEVVLLHALDELEKSGRNFRWVMTLPPTSPFRQSATVRRFVEALSENVDDYDCLFSVHENYGDFWVRNKQGDISRLFPDAPRRQQDREPLFEENSAIYISSVHALREHNSVLGRSVRGLVIDPIEAIDINLPVDFIIAESIMQQQLVPDS